MCVKIKGYRENRKEYKDSEGTEAIIKRCKPITVLVSEFSLYQEAMLMALSGCTNTDVG